jgi:hypothetical protein
MLRELSVNPRKYSIGRHQVAIFNGGYLPTRILSNVLRDIAQDNHLDLISDDWGTLLRRGNDYFFEANVPDGDLMATILVYLLSGYLQVEKMADGEKVSIVLEGRIGIITRLLCSSCPQILKR